jgi:hypothetical protein
MEHEGMVHALDGIKRLLRPDGSLIDIHPVREAPFIEVHSGAKLLFAEPSPSYDYDEDLRHAEDALARTVERGMFVIDRSREFDFTIYGSSVVELRNFMAEAGAYDESPRDEAAVTRQDQLYTRVEEVMRTTGDEVEVAHHERARMARLVPVR